MTAISEILPVVFERIRLAYESRRKINRGYMPHGIIVKKGVMVYASKAARKIYGCG